MNRGETTIAGKKAGGNRLTTRWKLLFATISLIVFVALVEFGLWQIGVPTLVEREDPFRGFSGMVTVFQRDGDVYRTRDTKSGTFNDQSFLAEKPAGGLRIFCLGGSSSYGFPWGAEAAFTSIVGEALAAAHPDRRIEAVNASGVSYAMHRLNIVADELLSYKPDVFIVFSGHNEFVEPAFFDALKHRSAVRTGFEYVLARSRIYSGVSSIVGLLRDKKPRPTGTAQLSIERDTARVYSPQEKAAIVAEYRWRLERLVRRAQQSGVKVVLCTVPCNLRGWRPTASTTLSALGEVDRQQWSEDVAAAKRRLAAGDFTQAALLLERTARIAPEHAETQFLLGQACEALGRWDDARLAYQRACDADAMPIRRLSAINDATREVALASHCLLVDVDRIFAERSEHGLVGFNMIEDYVHPTREAHELIAWRIWDAMERVGWLGGMTTAKKSQFDQVLAARRGKPARINATWLYNQGVVLDEQGRVEDAIKKYREALAISPNYSGALLNLSYSLLEMGQYAEAADFAERVTTIDPQNAVAFNNWGFALAKLGRFDEAIARCRQAVKLKQEVAKSHVNLGYALLGAGRTDEALQEYRQALQLSPDDADAHNDLGYALQLLDQTEQAIEQYREALRLNPEHVLAGNNLARALRKVGDSMRNAPEGTPSGGR